MELLIFFFVLSILFSFLCSIWEAVLLSITPSYVQRKLQEGSPIGTTLDQYKEDIDKPLSAILTLNTIAHTVGAIGVGAQAKVAFPKESYDLFGINFQMEPVIASLMTLAILILSEIIPKTIGANSWKRLAPFTVNSLKILLFVLTPFVWISQLITKRFKADKSKSVLSRADFAAMAQAGAELGTLDAKEFTIIQNLLHLEQMTARDIMTPRTVMVTADQEMTVKSFYQDLKPHRYSRIPIFGEKPGNITGIALMDDILAQLADDKDNTPLKELRRDVLAIQDNKNLFDLFETLTRARSHLAVVMDNYGSLVGLITLEDIIETLFGLEIMDESDRVPDLQVQAKRIWEERAKSLKLGKKGE